MEVRLAELAPVLGIMAISIEVVAFFGQLV
jgi:hypothetical protein